MKKWIELEFEEKQIVYLKTDNLHLPRIVTGICIREHGIEYELAQGSMKTWHWGYEVTTSVSIEALTNNPKDYD